MSSLNPVEYRERAKVIDFFRQMAEPLTKRTDIPLVAENARNLDDMLQSYSKAYAIITNRLDTEIGRKLGTLPREEWPEEFRELAGNLTYAEEYLGARAVQKLKQLGLAETFTNTDVFADRPEYVYLAGLSIVQAQALAYDELKRQGLYDKWNLL